MRSILVYENKKNQRGSLCSLLSRSEDYKVTAAFADYKLVESHVKKYRPDVILMDIDMPGVGAIDAVEKIRAFNRDVLIIMLSFFDDSENVLRALFAGANGYLLKKYISCKLIESIAEVLEGGAPLSPVIARVVVDSVRQRLRANSNNG